MSETHHRLANEKQKAQITVDAYPNFHVSLN